MEDRPSSIPLLEHIRPLHLLTALALYALGAGLARYLGARVMPDPFLLPALWMVSLLEGFFFLGDYFQTPFQGPVFPLQGGQASRTDEQSSAQDPLLLYTALALFCGTAVLTVLLAASSDLPPAGFGLMGGYFLVLAALTLPRLAVDTSGLGEFATTLCLVIFPPALAFLALYGDLHRYLMLAVFPLFPLHLALVLSLRLRSYPADLRRERKTLLVRIGWTRGIFLHNLLLLSGFLLFGAAALFGLPIRIAGPVFIALLPAAYLVWYYGALETGAPVRWGQILSLSLAAFLLPLYLLLFGAWIY